MLGTWLRITITTSGVALLYFELASDHLLSASIGPKSRRLRLVQIKEWKHELGESSFGFMITTWKRMVDIMHCE